MVGVVLMAAATCGQQNACTTGNGTAGYTIVQDAYSAASMCTVVHYGTETCIELNVTGLLLSDGDCTLNVCADTTYTVPPAASAILSRYRVVREALLNVSNTSADVCTLDGAVMVNIMNANGNLEESQCLLGLSLLNGSDTEVGQVIHINSSLTTSQLPQLQGVLSSAIANGSLSASMPIACEPNTGQPTATPTAAPPPEGTAAGAGGATASPTATPTAAPTPEGTTAGAGGGGSSGNSTALLVTASLLGLVALVACGVIVRNHRTASRPHRHRPRLDTALPLPSKPQNSLARDQLNMQQGGFMVANESFRPTERAAVPGQPVYEATAPPGLELQPVYESTAPTALARYASGPPDVADAAGGYGFHGNGQPTAAYVVPTAVPGEQSPPRSPSVGGAAPGSHVFVGDVEYTVTQAPSRTDAIAAGSDKVKVHDGMSPEQVYYEAPPAEGTVRGMRSDTLKGSLRDSKNDVKRWLAADTNAAAIERALTSGRYDVGCFAVRRAGEHTAELHVLVEAGTVVPFKLSEQSNATWVLVPRKGRGSTNKRTLRRKPFDSIDALVRHYQKHELCEGVPIVLLGCIPAPAPAGAAAAVPPPGEALYRVASDLVGGDNDDAGDPPAAAAEEAAAAKEGDPRRSAHDIYAVPSNDN